MGYGLLHKPWRAQGAQPSRAIGMNLSTLLWQVLCSIQQDWANVHHTQSHFAWLEAMWCVPQMTQSQCEIITPKNQKRRPLLPNADTSPGWLVFYVTTQIARPLWLCFLVENVGTWSGSTPCLRMNQFPYRGHEAFLVRARVSFNGNSKLEGQKLLSGWTHSRQPKAMRAMRRSNYLEPTPSSHKKLVLHMKDAKTIYSIKCGISFPHRAPFSIPQVDCFTSEMLAIQAPPVRVLAACNLRGCATAFLLGRSILKQKGPALVDQSTFPGA